MTIITLSEYIRNVDAEKIRIKKSGGSLPTDDEIRNKGGRRLGDEKNYDPMPGAACAS
jgi:hypothetical protein